MDENAVAKRERSARGNRVTPIRMPVVREAFQAERIHGKQAVTPSMPVRRMAEVPGMIEDSDADIFPFYMAVIVYPTGPLAQIAFSPEAPFEFTMWPGGESRALTTRIANVPSLVSPILTGPRPA
jgi:hypothetical protein